MSQLFRTTKPADEMFLKYPPNIKGEKKQLVYDLALESIAPSSDEVVISRWSAMMPQDERTVGSNPISFHFQNVFFDYQEFESVATLKVEWHLNFADEQLFVAYGYDIFAQDEIQCAEHPVLGSILEMLSSLSRESSIFEPLTADPDGNPTPILILGAKRHISIDMNPRDDEGRTVNIYGNRFQEASDHILRRACQKPSNPDPSNILAMSSLSYGNGAYSVKEIIQIILIAYTGFRAAVLETKAHVGNNCKTVIHTGDWGCGAFGGNKTLMASLQMLAADMADVDALVFHSTDDSHFKAATKILQNHWDEQNRDLEWLIGQLNAMEFQWGVSDGN